MTGARPRRAVHVMFRAFSDPVRLRILHLLRGGELCVGDLVEILHVPQPTASRHLAYLRRAALVATRDQGHWTYYRLAAARTPLHRGLLRCLSRVSPDRHDTLRRSRLRKSGGCCPR